MIFIYVHMHIIESVDYIISGDGLDTPIYVITSLVLIYFSVVMRLLLASYMYVPTTYEV